MNTVKPESIALFCLTPGGVRLAKRLAAMLPLTCYTSEALQEEGFIPFNGGFASAAREAFSSFSALIFIGATGIAVRVLAPLVNDKPAGCRSKPSAPRRCASTSTAFRPRLLSGRRSASAASPARWPGC